MKAWFGMPEVCVAALMETDPARSLWEHLGDIPDRRGRQGRQYGLPSVLTLVLAAMLSGANDLRAVFRWGRRLPPAALFLLGRERAPCHAMYHDFFKALDVAAAETVLGAWTRTAGESGHIALDGKRLRSSAPDGHDGTTGSTSMTVTTTASLSEWTSTQSRGRSGSASIFWCGT